jgi:peroxiredoxin family protein
MTAPLNQPSTSLAVFLHSGDYERMHQGLAAAAAAVASGRKVHLFFFWWALQRLADDALDEPREGEFGPGREAVVERFERRGLPTLRQLLAVLRESGLCTLNACTGSMAALGLEPVGMDERVDRYVGWSAILQLTAGITDRLHL